MFYGHFYFFPFRNISCKSFWNSSQQLQRCTSNDFCISRSPIVLGKRCHLSKMPFQFNQWPAKFNSFSVLKGQKSYWENTGGDGRVAIKFWVAKLKEQRMSSLQCIQNVFCYSRLSSPIHYGNMIQLWLWQNLK